MMIRSLVGTILKLKLIVRSSRIPSVRHNSTIGTTRAVPPPTEHKVVLDNQTLYISREVAECLGWKPDQGAKGTPLTLHGWEPSYFTITPSGSESEILSKLTIESSRDTNVKIALDHLKDR